MFCLLTKCFISTKTKHKKSYIDISEHSTYCKKLFTLLLTSDPPTGKLT